MNFDQFCLTEESWGPAWLQILGRFWWIAPPKKRPDMKFVKGMEDAGASLGQNADLSTGQHLSVKTWSPRDFMEVVFIAGLSCRGLWLKEITDVFQSVLF